LRPLYSYLPYGVRFPNPIARTAGKCTACYRRISRGEELLPACVEACPTDARRFGDAADRIQTLQRFLIPGGLMSLPQEAREWASPQASTGTPVEWVHPLFLWVPEARALAWDVSGFL